MNDVGLIPLAVVLKSEKRQARDTKASVWVCASVRSAVVRGSAMPGASCASKINHIVHAVRAVGGRHSEVDRISLFGSQARGDAGPGSDVDLYIEYATQPGRRAQLELADELECELRMPISFVSRPYHDLTPLFKKQLLKEGLILYERSAK